MESPLLLPPAAAKHRQADRQMDILLSPRTERVHDTSPLRAGHAILNVLPCLGPLPIMLPHRCTHIPMFPSMQPSRPTPLLRPCLAPLLLLLLSAFMGPSRGDPQTLLLSQLPKGVKEGLLQSCALARTQTKDAKWRSPLPSPQVLQVTLI